MTMYDLIISGCSINQSNTQFSVGCSRWDVDNTEHILEFWTDAAGRNKLYRSIKPGAVEELYDILGEKTYVDTTYSSSNTILIKPNPNAVTSSTISSMRFTYIGLSGQIKLGIRDYTEDIPQRESFHIKISGYEV